jgi:hypothetical protein
MECSFQGPDESDDGGMVIFFGELDPGSQENEDCWVSSSGGLLNYDPNSLSCGD